MRITVNGKPRDIESEMTLPAFLRTFNVEPKLVAIAINGNVIARDHYDAARVREGDDIEVVRMVGGGAL